MPVDLDNIHLPDPRQDRDEILDPETLEDKLTKLFTSRRKRLFHLHPVPRLAAARFIQLMEPRKEGEEAREVAVRGRDGMRIDDPFERRVLDCARRYLALSPGEQQTVVTGITEDRVPWRGDDIAFYLHVVGETHRMREMGVDAYRAQALRQMRGLLGGARG